MVGGQLGLAVVVVDLAAGQALHEFLQHFHRHDGGAVVALGEAGKIVLVEIRVAQQSDPDRRRGEEHVGPVAIDGFQNLTDVRRHEDVGAAGIKSGIEEDVALGTVVDGQRIHVDVAGFVAPVDDGPHVLGQQGLVADDNPLGQGLGAAGIRHLAGVLDVQDHVRRGGRGMCHPGIEGQKAIVYRRLTSALVGPYQLFHRGHLA